MQDDLTVVEAADALGTSPQTVRALLRKGELRGRRQPWGSRYVWVPSRKGVDEFLSEFGRLDGRRRSRAPEIRRAESTVRTAPSTDGGAKTRFGAPRPSTSAEADPFRLDWTPAQSRQSPPILRPRVRATAFLLVVGLPLIAALAAARIWPDALWFQELGQLDVFGRVVAAKAELYVLVVGGVALFVGTNLVIAAWRTNIARSGSAALAIVAASLVIGTFFGSSAAQHWETFVLWRHQQLFGVTDPLFGKDVGFFVFSLPFLLALSTLLLWLIAVAAGSVAVVYRAGDALGFRPPRAADHAQMHLSLLAAGFLLVVAWRFQLERYGLELSQPGRGSNRSFAGADYVDVHVRSPGLAALSILAVVLAFACVAVPLVSRRNRRGARLLVGIPLAALVIAAVSITSWIPALVQRFAVNPNPLLSEQPFLLRSIAATRSGLGLDAIEVDSYSPSGELEAADVSEARERLANVLLWDAAVVHARMLDLVTQTPYYRPEEPTFDVVRVGGSREPTMASARQLDIGRVRRKGQTWINDRLAYTHGLGLVRFSGTDIEGRGQPRLLDAGLALRQPRIYFGEFPAKSPSWVVADTRRPEVDIPSGDERGSEYHYDGSGGIALSSWIRRTLFAFGLGSKDLLLSDDITPQSRILLHREVHDRLRTLAPFIQWDTKPASLAADGRIMFVVPGYTTSKSYPYAERVELGGASVNYARSSVLATVDAFSGSVDLYITDSADPIVRAWAEAFPTLFRSESELPASVRDRLRYPVDLFDAQATAYERFHATQAAVFASDADAWSRPTSLSGPVDVAGDIQFDEDDEDELRHRMLPGYKFAPPPGSTTPQVVLSTYYSPRRGQNLVASLDGWVDEDGGVHLAARLLPRDPITLGPAQVSRLVFSTPRVQNLLGLRNLEVRDLGQSSIDAVTLGEPHILFLPSGVMQIQSLYEGTSGPGVSRILGVTAFLNGSAGLGSDIEGAVRQALHKPPSIDVLRPPGPLLVGTPVELGFRVRNAERELVTITSSAGRREASLSLKGGRGEVDWLPSAPGHARVRVEVEGLDGTTVVDTLSLRILTRPPTVRFIAVPNRAVVGRPVRVSFEVTNSHREVVNVSTREGVLERRYLIRNGTGLIEWTPQTPGPAVIRITTHGGQGQMARERTRLSVTSGFRTDPPTVTLVQVPEMATVRRESEIVFRVSGARVVVARIAGDGEEGRVWRFAGPPRTVSFAWKPGRPDDYRLTVTARGSSGRTAQVAVRLTARRAS
jgi:uncharacterized protein